MVNTYRSCETACPVDLISYTFSSSRITILAFSFSESGMDETGNFWAIEKTVIKLADRTSMSLRVEYLDKKVILFGTAGRSGLCTSKKPIVRLFKVLTY